MNKKEVIKENCYDKFWVTKDMENMAYMFEYVDRFSREQWGFEIDVEKFINAFMRSQCRLEMEKGHEKLLSQASRDSFDDFINVDLQGDFSSLIRTGDKVQYEDSVLFWVGRTWAYLHYREDILSKDLIELLPLAVMLHQYKCGHERGLESFCDTLSDVFKKYRRDMKKAAKSNKKL